MAKAVGKIGKKCPKGHLCFVDKQGRAKAVPMRWNKRAKKGRVALGGDVIKKKKGHGYFIKGMRIMEMKLRGGRKRGKKRGKRRGGRRR